MTLPLAAGLVAALTVFYYLLAPRRNTRLPPGPKPRLILGNALDIPLEKTWKKFTEWKNTYGDVIYLEALGRKMVILNSHRACIDLLDKRSAIYSDRPTFIMLMQLMGYEYIFSGFKYNLRWRVHRRLFHQYFDDKASKNYFHIQEKHVHTFLRRTLKEPEDFWEHVRLSFTETILNVAYDIKDNNKFIHLLEEAMKGINAAGVPGKYLVDLFPFLRYIPAWVPGATFQKDAAKGRFYAEKVKHAAAQVVKDNMKNGTGGPSVFGALLTRCEEGTLDTEGLVSETPEDVAKNVAAISFLGGADTTLIAIYAFFLAMANHPSIQQEAQAELDRVIGSSRLPTASDVKDMPYIQAVVNEVLRWHTPAPLGVVHSNSEEDVYRGYFIPKDSMVFPNVWAILHDEAVYPDPYSFNPSRWLTETDQGRALNPSIPFPEIVFGFGRRFCPGMSFAMNTLTLVIANVLASFDISPLGADGKAVDRIDYEGCLDAAGTFNYFKPFKVSMVPRSAKIAQIIADTE